MSRYIDADKLKQHYAWWNNEDKETFDEIVDAQPTADVRENVKGKWLQDKHDEAGYGYFDCSVCGADFYDVYDFCPNCGADMRADMRGEA